MQSLNSPGIRWLKRSQWVTRKLCSWIEAIQSSIFMGLVNDESLQPFDTFPFDETRRLDVRAETEHGLESWERQVVREHLADDAAIVIIAAGGARELVGLLELGYEASGIEFGRLLCEASRQELTRRGHGAVMQLCERFEIPRGDEAYDAAFVARKFLSHVHDRRRRIELLTNIRQALRPDGRLVIAFYTRERDNWAFRMQTAIANILRRLRGRRGCPVEVGDHIDPESLLYHHHFVWEELCEELREAGFTPLAHETTWFGWAVARPTALDESSISARAGLPQVAVTDVTNAVPHEINEKFHATHI